jgi:hypothetical protein
MSAASLASSYTARQLASADGTPPNVPDGLAKQLSQWIPTEALTVYAALLGILGGMLSMRTAGWLLAGCVLLDVVLVWFLAVLKTAKGHALASSGKPLWTAFRATRPYGEMLLSAIAFVLWVSALPGAFVTHLDGWKPEYGSALVVAAAVLVPLVAKIAGVIAPPADEQAAA